jgi:UDP-N-acetyl-D-glucosamine/UDP-N-acetyl-D-galactosamine dehydrogenase
MALMSETIAVIGLGYVGLPLAVALARVHPLVLGFDVNSKRISELQQNIDRTNEITAQELQNSTMTFSDQEIEIGKCNFYIVTVPTPIDENKNPDLRPLEMASKMIGRHLKRGDVIVYESTVYPGVTEDVCGAILETTSGLKSGTDFKLGYSPERINPGDKKHTIESIIKVISGQDSESLERIANVYAPVIHAGVHRAPSIKVAEAAKVIENTQRDLNIALMNELAIIFDRIGIKTSDVLEAAGTKWNFLKFTPGLVGGHCISVDPYYLTQKAQQLGYHPEVILAGRRVNDSMGRYIAQRAVKMLIGAKNPVNNAKIGVLGLTFKENVPDLRNSRVPDIINELKEFGVQVLVHDPIANPEEAHHEYRVELCNLSEFQNLDGLILAVSHDQFKEIKDISALLKPHGVIIDVKSMIDPKTLNDQLTYWSL